ncbi:MAG: tetratricopeptide repeat protein [Desulfarculus sp.]|nr:tetratricopeptide repeat protein [Desulfarculus sp.]
MAPDLPPSAPELTFDLLMRFEETLKPPFRRALASGRVDLLPPPQADPNSDEPLNRAVTKGRAVFDERGGRLVVPLMSEGRALGLLVIWGVVAEQLVPAVSPFLSSLVESSLDMVRLRLAAESDPITGLYNEPALDEALTHALGRLSPAKLRGRPALDRQGLDEGLALLACQPEGLPAILERYGRRFGDRLLREVARRINGLGQEVICAARVGNAFLVLVAGGSARARELAGRLASAVKALDLAPPQGEPWRGGLTLGAASLGAQVWEGGQAPEAAAILKSRALRALECAARLGLEETLFFHEIVDKAGRLTEVLPLDRVRLDLGRVHGLLEGERFQVAGGQEAGGAGQAKAEVMVVSVGEAESLAEVVSLGDPTWSLRSGDRLRRLGHEAATQVEAGLERVVILSGREIKVSLDEVTGLANHRSFMALFSALCAENKPLCAVLMRVEGMEGLREMVGRVGADTLMGTLAESAREVFPRHELLGRFAPDTLAALLPGQEPAAAQQLALRVLQRQAQGSERVLRAGVGYHPCPGFAAADCLDNAAKALVHAGFLEPGAVVIFDAVSLNVSGDELFGQGRLREAIREYEKALLLNPQEPNVLNSLGVCYGHLGQADKALEFFQRVLVAAPQDFMAHYNLGYALMGQGRLAEARQNLEQSLTLAPDHADTLFQLGRLAQDEGRLDTALDLLARASRQPGCRRAVHRHLGEALITAGRFSEAEEAFNQAVKVNPNDAAALSGLAGLYLERKANREIALSLARRARELEPQASRHLRVLAQALAGLDRWEEAAQLLRQGVAEHASDAFLALQLARVEVARGQKEAAREEYRRALGLEPNLQAAREGLASLEEV